MRSPESSGRDRRDGSRRSHTAGRCPAASLVLRGSPCHVTDIGVVELLFPGHAQRGAKPCALNFRPKDSV